MDFRAGAFERSPRGGGEGWDLDNSGPLLTAEFFAAPPPSGLQAARFDANADVLTMPTAALPSGSGGWTVAGWFRLVNDRNAVTTLWSLDGIFSSSWHSLRTSADGTSLKLNESGTDVVSIGSLTVGVWYFLAVRKDAAGNVKAYLGTEAGGALSTVTGTVTNIATYSGDGYVAGNAYGDWFDGRGWGLRLWDAALTDGEVDAEFVASTAARTTNLRAQWLLAAVPPTADSSGNARALTNSGGAWALESGPTLPTGSGVTGSIAVTLGAVTSAGSGARGAAGTVAATLSNATSAASGSTATGAVARTLSNATAAGTGAHGAAGTIARTLGDVTASAAGASVAGSVARTLADVTAAGTGTVSGATVTGTINVTLAPSTAAGAGSSVAGAIGRTLADVTAVGAGARGAAGSSAPTLAPVTAAGSGARGAAGSTSATLANATAVGAGSTVAGSTAKTLGDVTGSGAGTVSAGGATGSIAATLGAVAGSGAGAIGAAGAASATLGAVTATGIGAVPTNGAIILTLGEVTSIVVGEHTPPSFTGTGGGLRRLQRNVSVG